MRNAVKTLIVLIMKIAKSNLYLLLIIVITIIIYYPVLGCELLTNWDDQWQVTNKFTESGFTWGNISNVLMNFWHGQYSPLNQFMYIAIYEIGGYNPIFFHLVSLLLHISNVILVYIILKHILSKTSIIKNNDVVVITFYITLIFAIHPLQVETVAWISASKILNSTLFYLLATLMYIKYLEDHKIKYYVLTLILFILSYGCKEQVIVFPLWITLLSIIYKSDLKKCRTWFDITPFYIISFSLGVLFLFLIDSKNSVSYPFYQRVIMGLYSISEYIIKCLFPYKQIHIYPFPMKIGENLPLWMLSYPLMFAIIILSCYSFFKKRVVLFSSLFFIIHLILVLHIFPLRRVSVIADRYMYLSCIGVSLPIVYYIYKKYLVSSIIIKRSIKVFIIIYMFIISSLTYNRINVWENSEVLKKEIHDIKNNL